MNEPKFKIVYKNQIREVTNIDWVNKQVSFTPQIEIRKETDYGVSMDVLTTLRFDEVTFLRYTGIKDKEDKEVYEGNIIDIRVYDGISDNPVHIFSREVVEWDKVHAGFSIRAATPTSEWRTEYEIIGNIYENPELLKV